MDWDLLKTHVEPCNDESHWTCVFMGFPSWGSTLIYHGLLFMIWLRTRTKGASVPRCLLRARETQQAMAREVVLVQAILSGHKYLLTENTCNYQTANRKLKIAAPNICSIKCHYNSSTNLFPTCVAPSWSTKVWHSFFSSFVPPLWLS